MPPARRKTNARESQAASSGESVGPKSADGSLARFLITVFISLLAAGTGIVALLKYFHERGPSASFTVTASMTSPVTDPQLKQFVEDYVKSGNYSTPEVEAEFFTYPVIDYFGKSGLTREDLIADRKQAIEDWPTRRYSLQDPPQLLGKEGSDVFVVLAVIRYVVDNDKVTPAKHKSGISRSIYRIKATGSDFKIISVMEAKQQ